MTAASNSRGPTPAVTSTPPGHPPHRAHRRTRADFGEARHDRFDVGRRSAGDGAPRRRAEDREHAVVLEEDEQVPGRIPHRVTRRARPHRGHQRGHEVVHEVGGEAVPVQERADGLVVGSAVEQPGGGRVEPLHLGQHQQVPRPGQRGQRRKQPADAACACVFEPAGVVAHRHRHVGLRGGDAQLVEQPAQRRIGAVVVHQEGAVDADDEPVAPVDVVGVRVPAEPGVRLEQGDAVARRQRIGGDKAGHAAADHRDRAFVQVSAFHISYSEPDGRWIGVVVSRGGFDVFRWRNDLDRRRRPDDRCAAGGRRRRAGRRASGHANSPAAPRPSTSTAAS